jgi:hypothetical protein
VQGRHVGELEADVAAGDAPFQLVGGALGDDAAVVEDGDPIGELVGLVEVLGGEEDRDAGRGELAMSSHIWRRRAGRARLWARRGRSLVASRSASSQGRGVGASRPSTSTPACRPRPRARIGRVDRRRARGRRRGRGGSVGHPRGGLTAVAVEPSAGAGVSRRDALEPPGRLPDSRARTGS